MTLKLIRENTASLDEQFALFYSAYPLKRARLDAYRAFLKAIARGATIVVLLAAIDAQKADRQARYELGQWVPQWPYPATWLNGARWEDEIEADPRLADELPRLRL